MNPIKGQVPLKLKDGRELTLVADFDALVEAETAYGKPLQQLMADANVGFVGALRAMLFGMVRANQPEITLREAGEVLLADLEAVSTSIADAVEKGFPDTSPTSEGKQGPRPAGKRSGSNGAK